MVFESGYEEKKTIRLVKIKKYVPMLKEIIRAVRLFIYRILALTNFHITKSLTIVTGIIHL